jgi:uncharacterized protein (DUF885 family)
MTTNQEKTGRPMRKFLLASALMLVIASCGGDGGGNAIAPPAPTPPPTGPGASEQLAEDLQGLTLDEFYFESFKALIRRSPETVTWEALESVFPLDAVELDDMSDEFQRETFSMYSVVLDMLRSYDRGALTADQKLDYDTYEYFLQDTVDRLDFIYYDFRATYMSFSVQRRTQRFFTDIHPLATRQDAEDYITRLQAVDEKFDQLISHLNRQRDAGIVEPALTMNVALNQVAAIAASSTDNNPYFSSFAERVRQIPDLDDADRTDLLDRARTATADSVAPAYQRLQSQLQNLLNNAPPVIGVGQYPLGSEWYAYALRHHSTTDLTPAEVHQLGLDELARIHAEMRLVFDQLGYPQNETLEQLYSRVAQDGGIIPATDVKPVYEAIIADAESRLGEAFDIFPAADVIVLPDPSGGFYIAPSFDGTRPGAFYAGTDNDQAYFSMPSLTYHESVPGHHTQIAIAMEQDVPAFRKIVGFTGFVEGWALYAERLAHELGWYDGDPYGELGRLQFEALRAARLVIDTGIHSLGWSFEEAAQFNRENVGASLGASQGAAGRYSVWPGQATAYMIGMLAIVEQRQRATETLGPQFDLRAFHRTVLSNGAVPLALLDDVVDRYIEETQTSP